jgi:pyridoxal phosphate enzyme (YggS family)
VKRLSIQSNVERIRKNLNNEIIVAATKYVGSEQIRTLYATGIDTMGENRVQDLLRKQEELTDLPIRWHFIGHRQTNKVKSMINRIECFHSLDRIKLASEIQNERNQPLDCFIEVKLTDEPLKTGVLPSELLDFIRSLEKYDIIKVIGLMGMAKADGSVDEIRANFGLLRHLQQQVEAMNLSYAPCHYLSMGMSQDYHYALEFHSTHLRLGSILFRSEENDV